MKRREIHAIDVAFVELILLLNHTLNHHLPGWKWLGKGMAIEYELESEVSGNYKARIRPVEWPSSSFIQVRIQYVTHWEVFEGSIYAPHIELFIESFRLNYLCVGTNPTPVLCSASQAGPLADAISKFDASRVLERST